MLTGYLYAPPWMSYMHPQCPTQNSRDEVVDKPGNRDCGKADPVTTNDQQVRDLGVGHRILLETCWLLHAETPEEYGEGRDDTQPERQTPDSTQVVLAKDPEEDEGNKRGNDEPGINHGVCPWPPVSDSVLT